MFRYSKTTLDAYYELLVAWELWNTLRQGKLIIAICSNKFQLFVPTRLKILKHSYYKSNGYAMEQNKFCLVI